MWRMDTGESNVGTKRAKLAAMWKTFARAKANAYYVPREIVVPTLFYN